MKPFVLLDTISFKGVHVENRMLCGKPISLCSAGYEEKGNIICPFL